MSERKHFAAMNDQQQNPHNGSSSSNTSAASIRGGGGGGGMSDATSGGATTSTAATTTVSTAARGVGGVGVGATGLRFNSVEMTYADGEFEEKTRLLDQNSLANGFQRIMSVSSQTSSSSSSSSSTSSSSSSDVYKGPAFSNLFIHGVQALRTQTNLIRSLPPLTHAIRDPPGLVYPSTAQGDHAALQRTPGYRILSFLSTRELCSLSSLCRSLSYLTRHGDFWRSVDLSSCSPFSMSDSVVLPVLKARAGHVTHLNVSFLTQLSNAVPNWVSYNMPRLHTLQLEGCYRSLDDNGLVHISAIKDLRHLNLAGCLKLSAKTLSLILSGCRNLEFLSMGSVPAVNDQVLEIIAHHPNIHSLVLDGCAGISDVGITALAKARGSALKSLSIAYCERVTDVGLQALADNCHNIEVLNLYSVTKVTNKGVASVLATCTNLQSLNLSLITGVTDFLIRHIVFQRHLQSPAPPTAEEFIPSGLRELRMYGCKQLTDTGFEALQSCPELEHLDLFGCTNLSRDRAACLLFALGKLQRINLGGCPNISAQDIIDLAAHFKHVKFHR